MGIFTTTTPFDQIVEKVTDEKNAEDWGLIMEVCDRVGATTTGPKDCLRAIYKRLQHQDPHVVLQALTLLDACVNNCGQYFLLEVASRDFETEFRRILGKSHPKVQEKMRSLLKKWAEGEFSKDPKYSLIPSLYTNLKREGHSFGGDEPAAVRRELPKDPNVVSSRQEEDDIAKAIQLSLQEGGSKHTNPSHSNSGSVLYPTDSLYSSAVGGGGGGVGGAAGTSAPKAEKKARCLYDFEAAEDNELTFKAGEILLVLDNEDPNWWKGSNHRGEGLFPANFVTLDLEQEQERRKSVQFNEEVEVKEVEKIDYSPQLTIDEGKIDQLLGVLHELDPLEETDPPFLPQLEDQVGAMGPLIDTELERIDRQHARLTRLSHELVDALSLYHTLMRDMPAMPYQGYGMPPAGYGMPPGPMHPMGMPPHSMPGGMPMTSMPGIPGGMPPASMPGMPGGMPPTSMPSMQGGMPPTSMPGMHSMPPTSMPGMPMYYMDPNMPPQGGYMGSPSSHSYPGSAPPPTPPLYDPNMGQMGPPVYSSVPQ